MSLGIAYATDRTGARHLLLARWGGLTALLLCETALVAVQCDGWVLPQEDDALWAKLLRKSPDLVRLGATLVAVLLLSASEVLEAIRSHDSASVRPHRWWPFLAAQVCAFGLFFCTIPFLRQADLSTLQAPLALVVGWQVLGFAALLLWALATLPPACWLDLGARTWRLALATVLIASPWWASSVIMERLWEPLAHATLWLVNGVLALVFPDRVYAPDNLVVGSAAFPIKISRGCSGYVGSASIWVFLWLYLWLFRRRFRFPQALLLVPVGAALIWLLNILRIAALVAVGTWGAPAVAMGGFHSQAGWLALDFVALGLVAAGGRMRFFASGAAPAGTVAWTNPTAAYLGPFLAVAAATMIAGAFTSSFDWFYPLRVVAAVAVFCLCRSKTRPSPWSCSWQAVALGMAAFLLWVALVPVQAAGKSSPPAAFAAMPAGWAALWVAFRAAGYVLVVPVAEELAFRGYLTRRLIAADFTEVPLGRFTWLSFLLSSALFGALHGPAWVPGFLAGLLFALALYRRGQLGDAVLAHATANGLLAAYAALTGQWWLWS